MSWLLANSLVAAAFAGLVLLIGRCKPAPAVMHALWLFVLLKLVTPPLFTIPVDLSLWGAASTAVAARPLPTGDHQEHPILSPGAAPMALRERPAAPVVPAGATGAMGSRPAAQATTWSWQQVAVGVWLTGSGVMLTWLLVGLWRGHRRLRALGPVPATLQRELEALAAPLGVRVPTLRDDPAATSPYVWSFGRTCLVVPVRTLATATAKGRAAVLVHELAHLRRGDHWLAHAELLLAVGLWWHPLFWFARARLRLWAELACDAWAVASVPDATLDYASVLVDAVARPESSVPAPAVLAARPAARAAFERRLQMILNENVPCRASRAWWLPFTSLALGLFTVPVAAQKAPQDPVRVEIKVNGKQIDELSSAERTALLKQLLKAEEEAAAPVAKKPGKKVEGKPAKKAKVHVHDEGHAGHDAGSGVPSGKEVHEMMRAGLAEARAEIEADDDLRELGITEDVLRLLDDVGAGKGVENGIDAVIRGAMKGAGRMIEKELAADDDLREMGMTDGITRLVLGFLENERTQEMISDFALRTAKRAMQDARRDVRADPDLRKLGIDVEVDGLLEGLFTGKGDFDAQLQSLIEKAMQGAMQQVERHEAHERHGAHERHEGHENGAVEEIVIEEPPAPKKKAAKKVRTEIR